MVNTGRKADKGPNLAKYDCHIERATTGGGLILCYKGIAHSLIEETKKYRERVCQEFSIPLGEYDAAIAAIKRQPPDTEKEENQGAAIIRLAKAFSESIFKDQLDEGYLTYIEKLDTKDTRNALDTRFLYVIPNHLEYINKTPNPSQSNNRELVSIVSKTDSSVQDSFDVQRTVRLRSRECRRWLAKLYYIESGKAPGSDSINSAILILEADAKETRIMFNRIAPDGEGGIWWDMSDEWGRAIHITKEGWKILLNPPQIFKHYPHQKPLKTPSEKGSLLPLLDYIIINDPGHQLLSIITPITYLVPEVPHVIEIVSGSKGSTKSSRHRFNRMVIDPSATPLLALPSQKDLNQMVQHADHHYFLIYDNVTKIDEEQSDLLCRVVTGLGFSKRMLYTDDETVIRQLKRCVAINGINIPADKPDLLDRSVIQMADMMKDEKRKTEADINKKMEKDAPMVIRAFLDILVLAMNHYDGIKPIRNNRMADYTKWGYAISMAMGLETGYFANAYQANIDSQDEEVISSQPVADWLLKWIDYNKVTKYSGSASDIHQTLTEFAADTYNQDLKYIDDFPKGATPMGKKLKEIAPSLVSQGINIGYGKSGSRRYDITRIVNKEDGVAGQLSLVSIAGLVLTSDKLVEALRNFEKRYEDTEESN